MTDTADLSAARAARHAEADNAGVLQDGYRATDTGNSLRLVEAVAGRARFVPSWGVWIVHDGVRWVIDTSGALITEMAKGVARAMLRRAAELNGPDREALWRWAVRSEDQTRIAAMIRLARGVDGVLLDHAELDQHEGLLNVENGTLDLRTGELLEHDPAHLITKVAPVAYDPEADAPLWEQCLATWQPNPAVRAYLQRLIGSGATGHAVEHLAVNVGGGANGKGKFYGATADVLGPDYCIVPHKSLLIATRHEQHPAEKARLFGARLAVAAETEAGDRIDEAKVKELTGGDLLEARRMRENPWQFRPSHTLVLHTNYPPRVRGGDEGIWRRIQRIPWSVTIPEAERDTHLAAKLRAEASGILNWIIAGAKEYLEHDLCPPDEVANASAEYRLDEDVLGRFLTDRCRVDPTRSVPASELREAYEQWCVEAGENEWTPQMMGRQLTGRGFDTARVGKANTRTWVGLDVAPTPGNTGGDR